MGRLRQQPRHHGLQVAASGRSRSSRPSTPISRPCWSISPSWRTSWTACSNPSTADRTPETAAELRARQGAACRPSSTPISKSASAAAARRSPAGWPATCPCSPPPARSWISAAAAANSWPCCSDSGRRPLGLDLSDSMLEEARARGLDCRKADALDFLKDRPAASLDGIFSSQVIEHFQPDYLRRVIAECFRVLRPGARSAAGDHQPPEPFRPEPHLFPRPHPPAAPAPGIHALPAGELGLRGRGDHLTAPNRKGKNCATVDPASPQALPFNDNVDRLNRLLFSPSEYAVKGVKRP